jgi:hypothetical protein
MRIYRVLVGLLLTALCTSWSLAQDTKIAATTELLPDGHVRFVVTNRSTQPITALYVRAEGTSLASGTPQIVSHRFFDSVINVVNERDLTPQHDKVFILAGPSPGPSRLRTNAVLVAALFSDGSSWGNQDYVQRLIDRRRFMLQYVSSALKTLQDAASGGETREQLTHRFQTLRDAASSAVRGKDERPFALGVYDEVLDNLGMDTSSAGGLTLTQRVAAVMNQLLMRQRKLLTSKPPLAQSAENASAASQNAR